MFLEGHFLESFSASQMILVAFRAHTYAHTYTHTLSLTSILCALVHSYNHIYLLDSHSLFALDTFTVAITLTSSPHTQPCCRHTLYRHSHTARYSQVHVFILTLTLAIYPTLTFSPTPTFSLSYTLTHSTVTLPHSCPYRW